MRSPDAGRIDLSRRAIVGGVAGLAAGRTLPSTAAETVPELTVMTRNLYPGVRLSRLFRARSMSDVRRIAGRMLDDIESHPFSARAEAIAGEVEATRPDVVGLQEAVLIRTQRPGDFDDDPLPNASQVVVDLLDLLSSKLRDCGLEYEVAASTATTDLEVPADGDGQQVDVRLTDRTAVLVRSDVETGAARTDTFDAALRYPLQGTTVTLRRGYCLVDVTVENAELTVATVHLESVDADVRLQQAEELLTDLPTDGPVVLAGDINSGPASTEDSYALLTESFDDVHASIRPAADGYTCCHDADLRNEPSRLSRRIDVVLARGDLEPTAVERVGADPDSRVTAEVDGETARLWPSDHAGVVATLEAAQSTSTPTPVDTSTSTEISTSTPTEGSSERGTPSDETGDGFGPLVALAALAAGALAGLRGKD